MEMGAYGADIGMRGYPNGASLSYLIYILIFGLSFFLVTNKKLKVIDNSQVVPISFQRVKYIFITSTYILIIFLFLMLFVFGGINVLMGSIGKGSFRLNIGFFGFFAYMITKLFAPAILVYLTVLFKKYRDVYPFIIKRFYICLILVALIGATWGFKSTAITLLIPSAIIFYDQISLKKLAVLAILIFSAFSFFSILFDGRELNVDSNSNNFSIESTNQFNDFSALEFVFYRLTVMQGNSAWRVWDLYSSGYDMPNYWMTLTSVFGDKVLSLSGIDHTTNQDFINTHYSYLITNMVTSSNSFLTFEHNVTSTAFSEGIILGGLFGVIVIGFILGYLCGLFNNKFIEYYNSGKYIKLSILAVFFVSYFRSWMNSGGLVTVLHISAFVGLALTYLLLKFISKLTINP